jgi:hypothetical protein
MLIASKKYAANDIVTFKLVNGDETIAKIVEETADHYVINKPCTGIPTPNGLALMQSLVSGDINTNIVLEKKYVIMHTPTADRVQAHYIETTTGIKTAPKGGIVI